MSQTIPPSRAQREMPGALLDYLGTTVQEADDCTWITYHGRHICITDGHGRHERTATTVSDKTEHQWGFTATEAERKDFANQMAKIYGMRPGSILIEPGDGPGFLVGNESFTEGGHYSPMVRTITLWADDHSPAEIGALVPHEVMHDRFHLFMDQVKLEQAAFAKEIALKPGQTMTPEDIRRFGGAITPRERELVLHPIESDRLSPAGAKLFPALAALRDFQDEMSADGNRAALASYATGLSDYAGAYWKAFLAGKMQTDRTINETLAEIHRYTANKPNGEIPPPYLGYGKEPERMTQAKGREIWQTFYRAVLANAKEPV